MSVSRSQAHAAMMTDWSHAFNYRNAVAGIELQAVSHDWKYDIGAGSASNYSPAAGFLVTESWKLVFRAGKTGYTRTRGVPTRIPVRRRPIPAGAGRSADPYYDVICWSAITNNVDFKGSLQLMQTFLNRILWKVQHTLPKISFPVVVSSVVQSTLKTDAISL